MLGRRMIQGAWLLLPLLWESKQKLEKLAEEKLINLKLNLKMMLFFFVKFLFKRKLVSINKSFHK